MNESSSAFVRKFNEIADESMVFTFITRDTNLQNEACIKLEDILAQASAEKASAIAAGAENYANVLLGCECVARALIAEIKMWILLKEGRPDEAWERLVAAQDGLLGAVKAHEGFAHIVHHIRRLDSTEELVFPPQVFLSSGMIVSSQICSICGDDYEECPHVKGRPYMGQFCTVTLIPSKVDHVAIVETPADKRCRILRFSTEGGNRNRMTWRVEPNEIEVKDETQGLTTQGITATNTTFAE
jgi:hypothetical protein